MGIRTLALLVVLSLMTGCVGFRTIPSIQGLSSEQVFARFGPYTLKDEIYAASSAKEARQEPIRKMYPPNEAKIKQVAIREISWEYDGRIVTVFFRKERGYWIAIAKVINADIRTDGDRIII